MRQLLGRSVCPVGSSVAVLCASLGQSDEDSDPTTPCQAAVGVAVLASVTLDVDIASVQEGSSARQQFERDFQRDMAGILGVDANRVQVLEIVGGSVQVEFEVLPAADGTSLPVVTLQDAFDNGPVEIAGASADGLGEVRTATFQCTQVCDTGYQDEDCDDIPVYCAPWANTDRRRPGPVLRARQEPLMDLTRQRRALLVGPILRQFADVRPMHCIPCWSFSPTPGGTSSTVVMSATLENSLPADHPTANFVPAAQLIWTTTHPQSVVRVLLAPTQDVEKRCATPVQQARWTATRTQPLHVYLVPQAPLGWPAMEHLRRCVSSALWVKQMKMKTV